MFPLKFIWFGMGVFTTLAIASYFLRSRYSKLSAFSMWVAAAIWLVFGLLERSAQAQKANIRVDLLLTLPILVIGTIWTLVHWIRSFRQHASAPQSRTGALATAGWGIAGFVIGVVLSRIPSQFFAILSGFMRREVVPAPILASAQVYLLFLLPPLVAVVMIVLARKGKLPGTRRDS
jgi:hypothetical protein